MTQSADMQPATPATTSADTESRRIELDAEMRRAELAEKRAQRESEERCHELDHKLKLRELEISSGRGLHFTSAQATVAAAFLALLSAGVGGLVQALATRSVEASKNDALVRIEQLKADSAIALDREKFETSLIVKAIETPGRDNQVRNLQFFVAAGFIKDPNGNIKSISLNDYPSSSAPMIAPASSGNDYAGISPDLLQFITMWEGASPDPAILRTQLDEIKKIVTVPLNGNQLAALASLVTNIGIANFKLSTLVTHLNQGDMDAADQDFLHWNKIGGREFVGLTRRREAEAALFRLPIEASRQDGGAGSHPKQ